LASATRQRSTLTLIISLAIAGCSRASPSPLQQPTPTTQPPQLPSAASSFAPTEASTPTPLPLTSATAALVLEPPQPFSSPTATIPPINLPRERISILRPGPGSQVVSPIHISGRAGPSWEQEVHLRLTGEDGRVIAERTTYILSAQGRSGVFQAEIEFAIPLVAEAARLEVSTQGMEDRQLAHQASVDIVLLSVGRPLIHPALEGPEKLLIQSPKEEETLSGGVVHVRGAGWVDSMQPLTIAVLGRKGEVLGLIEVELLAPGPNQLGTFEVDVPYAVSERQTGRVAVYERGGSIPGLVHYSSVRVIVEP